MAFPVAESDIEVAERGLGVRLPPRLRERLAVENGGEVETEQDSFELFKILDTSGTKRLARASARDIVRENAAAHEWPGFPADAVTIADNGSGDFLVLLRNDQGLSDTAFVWTHETEELESVGTLSDLNCSVPAGERPALREHPAPNVPSRWPNQQWQARGPAFCAGGDHARGAAVQPVGPLSQSSRLSRGVHSFGSKGTAARAGRFPGQLTLSVCGTELQEPRMTTTSATGRSGSIDPTFRDGWRTTSSKIGCRRASSLRGTARRCRCSRPRRRGHRPALVRPARS